MMNNSKKNIVNIYETYEGDNKENGNKEFDIGYEIEYNPEQFLYLYRKDLEKDENGNDILKQYFCNSYIYKVYYSTEENKW